MSRSRTIPRQGRGAVSKRCRVWLRRCVAFWTATVISRPCCAGILAWYWPLVSYFSVCVCWRALFVLCFQRFLWVEMAADSAVRAVSEAFENFQLKTYGIKAQVHETPDKKKRKRSRTIPRQGRGAVSKRCRVWLRRCVAFWTATVISRPCCAGILAWYWPLVSYFSVCVCWRALFVLCFQRFLWVEMAADSAVSLEKMKSLSFFDLIHMPIKVLFKQLKCTKEGLTSEDAANRLQIFGPNKLKEKKVFHLHSCTHLLR
ncbi:hypothetical protein MRB53_012430 [Persea americana]|uniref:Uncharacterized protein n=1 Tax=Persea americana TaxID=3435 RepID=A0ACC2LY94_PERAE|nr:hypothetical protein MRB53_012430 [Persea americana]